METAEKSESDQAIFYDALCHGFDRTETADTDDKIKIPNLEIAQVKFHLTLPEFAGDDEKMTRLMASVKADNMAPYYEMVCDELRITTDKSLLKSMQEANRKSIEYLDSEIDYALKNLGTADVKETYLNKANYLSKIGNKTEAIAALDLAYRNTIALGYKLENIFHCIRLGLFFHDLELMKQNLSRCEELIQEGADWHYRNCFKIYKGEQAPVDLKVKTRKDEIRRMVVKKCRNDVSCSTVTFGTNPVQIWAG
ncbi:hypothetical protein GWI33_019852 [Rhynchophorus ferrugineus]|uniref:26S proteasome regulatory subunit Rpn7 N-terminal domain-containing protein n=1 Tax=Rhynchophorus ferrugineus TaxID=354439 RepID=A0A834HTI4_RHYFE|nr:hypothetical protein GWI33_019852 [Rhynchophorus ferrugineus]